ncbi:M12 family metallo-peptidase [Nocardioides sp. STR2]|uniref:M12 family metallo-peptidase n=1 Tax=Nocardioides pini TaxID=2975053 RepID=A0ABT4CHR6_9ACTN|nr:M12 family metallo-peptidase [Nocardioides pini]MCY4728512.1 M12 family metallo-peptidase [Nocardioides pini]
MPITVPTRSTSRTLVGVAGLCVLALAATTAPVTTATASQDDRRPVDLLSPAPSGRASAEAAGDERSRAVAVDTAALDAVRTGDRIDLELFDDTTVTAAVDQRTDAGGITSWSGGIVGEKGSVTGVVVGGVAHINVTSVEHGTYEVRTTPEGDYVVDEAGDPPGGDDVVLPERPGSTDLRAGSRTGSHEHSAEPRAQRDNTGTTGARAPIAFGDAPDTIDIAIVYPAQLVTQMGQPAMEAQFALGITQANEAFATSGVGTRVRLVGTRQVAATQSSDLVTNLKALGTPGDGVFDEAHALREETHADLVSLWLAGSVPGGASCGIAYLGGTDPQYDPQYAAWSVVYAAACATEFRAFAHEVGHNLSAHHDAGASQPPTEGKPYARGYVDVAAQTITVMAYYDQCLRAKVNCTRIGYFSNPAIAYNGRVQGTEATNNALAITEQMATVAGYRQSQIYPGAVAIAGRPRFKGTAEATSTPWSPAVTLGYQWLLDGVAIPGATASTYRLGRRDIGKTLTLQVSGSAPYYPTVTAPAASVVVGKALFRTKRPKLRGVPRAGRVLSVKVKGWKPKPAKKSVTVRYQWLKNGKKIKGAKKATYRVRAKDRGKKISVRVTAKKSGYEKARASSKQVKIRR